MQMDALLMQGHKQSSEQGGGCPDACSDVRLWTNKWVEQELF